MVTFGKKIALYALTTTLLTSTTFAQARIKQMVADIDKVMSETEEYKSARVELENEGKKGQESFMKKRQAFEKQVQDFQKQQAVLNDQEKQKRQTELAEANRKFEEEYYKFKMDFDRKSNEKFSQIRGRIEAIGREITDEMDGDVFYGTGLNSPVYIYARGATSIDEKLRDRYNKQYPMASTANSSAKKSK